MLERMRSALAAGCPDPSLPRALEAMDALAGIVRDPEFPKAERLVDAYFTAFGDALRYVYVDMLAPFLPTKAQLRVIAPSVTTAIQPSVTMFLFGFCTHALKVVSHRHGGPGTPTARLFRSLAKRCVTDAQRSILVGILCLAAYFDAEDAFPDQLDAALDVGLEVDPTHPLFFLTRARHVPATERGHWARRGLEASSQSPMYKVTFQACLDPARVDLDLFARCVRPWVPAFVDRAVLRPLFRGEVLSVDMDAFTRMFTCDGCNGFALHLCHGMCSRVCARRRRHSPPRTSWDGACAALKIAVETHACDSCGGLRGACYCAAMKRTEVTNDTM